jgi:Uma2 family endonuclease
MIVFPALETKEGRESYGRRSAAAIRILGQSLLGRCKVMTSDAKVRVEMTDFAGFPDATVVYGDRQASRIDAHAVINPTILVEVTSRSTEEYDRGEKLGHSQRLPSLKAVLFISHRAPRVTLVERRGSTWVTEDARAGERVTLLDPACSFTVDELYAGISLDPA